MQCRVSSVALLLEFWVLSVCALHNYHLVNIKMNWTDAQSYCRKNFVDLATIDSMEDMQGLINQLKNQTGYRRFAWIGLRRDRNVSSWKWSLNGSQFYRKGEMEYRNWAQTNTSFPCAALVSSEGGVWRDYKCTRSLYFVCFKSSNDPDKPKFILVLQPKTWRDAQLYCRERYTDLASIRNQAENMEMQNLALGQNGSAATWIGLFKDDWKWSDQSSSSFRHWMNDKPEGTTGYDCAYTYWSDSGEYLSGWENNPTGKWINYACSTSPYSFCHSGIITKKLLGRVELVPNSPSDLEDPVFLDSILQQIRAAGRIPEQSTLRWKKQQDGKVFHKKEDEEEGGRGDTCH